MSKTSFFDDLSQKSNMLFQYTLWAPFFEAEDPSSKWGGDNNVKKSSQLQVRKFSRDSPQVFIQLICF
jgi:hypothetical protein